MERKIKFRGKTINGNEWIYGPTISQGTIKRKANKWFMEVGENKWKGLQPNTLGQYTGLKDKNGKEIYEGDIVKNKEVGGYGMVYIGVVKYYEEDCRFGIDLTATNKFTKRCLFTVGKCSFNDGHCTIEYYNEYEVLGNIHDNPELLKDGRD